MKLYVTGAHFLKNADQNQLKQLSVAIRAVGMKDFNFFRDAEQIPTDKKLQWERIYDELGACDGLLIDTTTEPTDENIIECGMAYALRKQIIIVARHGSDHSEKLKDLAATFIKYDHYKDITASLKTYDTDRNFTITDKAMLFAVLLAVGGGLTWLVAQLFIPLAPISTIIYWLIIRRLFASMRDFDRIVIYIPLGALWFGGIALLLPLFPLVAWAWAILFWLVILIVIRKLKLSL